MFSMFGNQPISHSRNDLAQFSELSTISSPNPVDKNKFIASPKHLFLIKFLFDGLGVAAVSAAQDGLLAVDGVGAPSRCVAAEGASLPRAVPAKLFAKY